MEKLSKNAGLSLSASKRQPRGFWMHTLGRYWHVPHGHLAVNDDMGVAGATSVLFCMGVGFIIGTIAGGKLGQHLYKKDKKLQAWLTGLTMWGGMLPLFILFSTDAGLHIGPSFPFMV